jgi:hypothetical protein
LWAYNLCFRARLAGFWETTLPKDSWDFASDVKITEFYFRLQ